MMSLFNDTELFTSGEMRRHTFELPDAELTLWEHFFPRAQADIYYEALLKDTEWKQEPITIHGKTHLTPRLTAWYGNFPGDHPLQPLTPTLQEIKAAVEQTSGVVFNSVLLNLYRTGQDSVSWHRDHEREFGQNPIIASVSFGETRPFQVRHKFRKELAKIEIPLHHGSLLLMGGPMQHYWEHQVPKTTKDVRPRINLTFRRLVGA